MNLSATPILSIVTVLPLAGALFIATQNREAVGNIRYAALWTSLITFVVSLLIWAGFDASNPGFQLIEEYAWLGPSSTRSASTAFRCCSSS